jgi:hypothetical protein
MLLALRPTPATDAKWIDKASHWTIKTRLVTQYPHGGIVIGKTLYHSTARKGVHSVSEWSPERWVLFDVGGDDVAALARFKEREGNGYDWIGLLPFIGVPGSDKDRDYCFELAFYMMTGVRPGRLVTAEALLAISMQDKRVSDLATTRKMTGDQ